MGIKINGHKSQCEEMKKSPEVDDGGCSNNRNVIYATESECVCVCVYFTTISKGAKWKEKSYLDQTLFPSVLARDFLLWDLRIVCVWGGCGWCISRRQMLSFKVSPIPGALNEQKTHWTVWCSNAA